MKPSEAIIRVRAELGNHSVHVIHGVWDHAGSVRQEPYWRVSIVDLASEPTCGAGEAPTLEEATDLCIANWRAEH